MNRFFKRVVAFFLSILLVVSLSSGALASNLPATITPDLNSAISLNGLIVAAMQSTFSSYQKVVDFTTRFSWRGRVNAVSAEELDSALLFFNSDGMWGDYASAWGITDVLNSVENDGFQQFRDNMTAEVVRDPAYNIARIQIKKSGIWVVDQSGLFPYCSWDDWNAYKNGTSGVVPDDVKADSYSTYGKWYAAPNSKNIKSVNIVSESFLNLLLSKLVDSGCKDCGLTSYSAAGGPFKVIYRMGDHNGQLFGDSNGRIYGFPLSPSAMDTPFDYYTPVSPVEPSPSPSAPPSDGTSILKDFKLIDLSNGQFVFVNEEGDKFEQNIESLSYNFDQRSYTVNTYNTTYNTTNNYYEYNYYTYNIQYTYNNTYVTYIGSTAEFVPTTYELYYELPDGRSSADLTAEDIAGLSFQFCDVINYTRGVTDESLLALYHFDGDTDDASFYNDEDSFVWNSGASITYMESNAFEGALYLDEQPHEFVLTLPKALGTGNFTLQWRYYQNAAVDQGVHNDNYITSNGVQLFGWSEQYMYALGTTQLSTGLSVGTWQELALIRVGSTLYFYHNGIMTGSASLSSVLGNSLTFHFGGGSKAYGMLDELRVLDFAYVTEGKRYSPSVVPFDTNQVLVLPQAQNHIVVEEIPGTDDVVIHHKELVDQYWEFTYQKDPLIKLDFTGLSGKSNITFAQPWTYDGGYALWNTDLANTSLIGASPSICYLDSSEYNYSASSGITFKTALSSNCTDSKMYDDNWYCGYLRNGEHNPFIFALNRVNYGNSRAFKFSFGTTYYAFVIFDDGSSASVPFSFSYPGSYPVSVTKTLKSKSNKSFSFMLRALYGTYETISFYGNATIKYLEFTEGAVNPHQYVYDYYEWDEVIPGTEYVPGQDYYENLIEPNTAAIQTDILVKGYTVGGVRPTFPQRGDVWMPVEGSRISGVQVYNGRAWEETNARWWTGSRWIPIYAFDICTLADMWDVGTQDGTDVIPPITSENSFWNWWQKQWLDFRAWMEQNGGMGTGPGTVYPDQGTCEHTHVERVLTQPTCTTTGTGLYVCTKCGDSYVQTIPANGHDWLVEDSILDELDEDGAVVEPGYDLYRCSTCGEEYKDFSRTGPPGETDSSSLVQLIQHLFEALGELVGSLISWVLDLGATAMEGFAKVGEFFEKTAGEIKEFGGDFAAFLGSFFGVIPPELMSILSLAVLLLGLGLFIRHVLL